MPLTFPETDPDLPNNISSTRQRLEQLKRHFVKQEKYRKDYSMNNIIDNGYAEEVQNSKEENNPIRYIQLQFPI